MSIRFAARAVVTLVSAMPLSASAQGTIDAFMKGCDEKTIVMGRDEQGEVVTVGEKLDGYCQGFLEGVFAVLVRQGSICLKDEQPTPDFLLTVRTFLSATPSNNPEASSVAEAAFKRAFNCAN